MTTLAGLTTTEVTSRRQQGLANMTHSGTGRTYGDIVRANLFSYFNNILFVVGTVLALLGRYNDAFITVIVGLTNAVISTIQEIRAKKQLDQIAVLARPKVTVMRNGTEEEIVAGALVQGDVVRLRSGDQAVVDGRVMAGGAELDESLLSGESDLIRKQVGDEILSGSFCVTGDLYYEAEQVGNESFANKLTAAARTYDLRQTPLQSRVGYAVRLLMALAVLMGVIFYVAGFIQDFTFVENVKATAVLIGLVPYGLFLTIAVAYALGAVTIANRGALVQQSNAVESLSNIDVLCMDKTGTLTANRLILDGVTALGEHDEEYVRTALGNFIHTITNGNTTSSAIAAGVAGEQQPISDEVAFASSRKWSALAFDAGDCPGAYVLGAIEMMAPALPAGTLDEDGPLAKQIAELSDKGLRVLIFAYNPTAISLHDSSTGEPQLPPLTLLALVTLRDELRPQARETLAQFAALGIQLKIISGDNPQTVAALARQAGFEDPKLVAGPELAKMNAEEVRVAAEDATIFGRISPEQKQQLVDVLTAGGHYVAMMGDGVNDVLSLKKAKLGIAMQSGSNATRNVADMVLMGDSFGALIPALSEGKRIINGITDATYLLVGRGLAYAMIIVGVMMVGLNFPFEPAQLGLTTFSVGFPAFMLTLWARPEERNEPLLPSLVRFVLPFAIWTMIIGVILYALSHTQVIGLLEEMTTMNIPQRAIDFFELVTGLTYGIDADFEMIAATLVAQTQLSTFVSLATMLLVLFLQPPTTFFAVWRPISPDRRPAYLTIALMALFLFVLGIPPVASYFGIINVPLRSSSALLIGLVVWVFGFRLLLKQRWFDRLLLMENW